MNKLSWVEIEGIRYECHDGYVVCMTDVGFSSIIHGNKLEDLGVSDKNGKEIGCLSINFSDNSLLFSPSVSSQELGEESIRIGYPEYVENVLLQDVAVVPAYDSILVDDSNELLISDYGDGELIAANTPPIECLVFSSDETLDSFFGASSDVESTSYIDDTSSTLYSADLVAVYLEHGIDDSLMPMLPEAIDLSNLIIQEFK